MKNEKNFFTKEERKNNWHSPKNTGKQNHQNSKNTIERRFDKERSRGNSPSRRSK